MFPKSNLWEVPFTFLVPGSSTRTLLAKLYSALRRDPLARERATLAERGGSVGLREWSYEYGKIRNRQPLEFGEDSCSSVQGYESYNG
jgi:hypothetical protein